MTSKEITEKLSEQFKNYPQKSIFRSFDYFVLRTMLKFSDEQIKERYNKLFPDEPFDKIWKIFILKSRQIIERQKSDIEEFARDYASNVADNEKEYFIAKDAVMKTYEFLTQKQFIENINNDTEKHFEKNED